VKCVLRLLLFYFYRRNSSAASFEDKESRCGNWVKTRNEIFMAQRAAWCDLATISLQPSLTIGRSVTSRIIPYLVLSDLRFEPIRFVCRFYSFFLNWKL